MAASKTPAGTFGGLPHMLRMFPQTSRSDGGENSRCPNSNRKEKRPNRRCGEPRAAARQVLDLFHDSNGELEDGDGFVIGLCDAFVDQAQRSGAGTFGAKEKSANTARAQPHLIANRSEEHTSELQSHSFI